MSKANRQANLGPKPLNGDVALAVDAAGHVRPSPSPVSWRVNGCTLTRGDGTSARGVVVELATPVGVHTTYWTTQDALKLRDALTERASGLTIGKPG